MGHFFSKVSLFIDKKEAAAHLILDQDFATAPFWFKSNCLNLLLNKYHTIVLNLKVNERRKS